MQTQRQFADSSLQSRAILGAWQTGDVQTLGRELDRVDRISPIHSDFAEAERMELLAAIACDLRESYRPFEADCSKGYCGFLEDLAFSGRQARATSNY